MPSNKELPEHISAIIVRLDRQSAVRDRALTEGRQIVRISANAIRAAHRSEFAEASTELERARIMLDELNGQIKHFPAIYWSGYVQDAMKEYVEANLTLAVLQHQPLPSPSDLRVEDAAYLNGLAEAASELRRDTLDAMRRGDINTAEYLVEQMDEMYLQLIRVDFPDALTGGLRRTTDALRPVLERTRSDVTMTLTQERLRESLTALLRQEGVQESPSVVTACETG